ncbi:MAG: hypothetical protein ABS36_17940 [Acidobacteria bacterium SCN 69-37]|nr:MAG: hypothetical protein ABS36_17940 [Acidobacteria bacterium SCN 69-37]
MNLLDAILNAQGGAAVQQAGASVGLSRDQTLTAMSALIPALAGGLQQNTSTADGLAGLLGALTGGQHQQYLDNPSLLSQAAAFTEGNGILGHILGSKDVSRQVATQASASTGISADVLKKLLPLVATMVMGALSQQRSQIAPQAPAAGSGGLAGMLGSLLDSNRDGSVVDDVASMLGRMLR